MDVEHERAGVRTSPDADEGTERERTLAELAVLPADPERLREEFGHGAARDL